MKLSGKIAICLLFFVLISCWASAGLRAESNTRWQTSGKYSYVTPAFGYTVRVFCVGNSVYKEYIYPNGMRISRFVKTCPAHMYCYNGFCTKKGKKASFFGITLTWGQDKCKPKLIGKPYCKRGNLWQLYRNAWCQTQELLIETCPYGCFNGRCLSMPARGTVEVEITFKPKTSCRSTYTQRSYTQRRCLRINCYNYYYYNYYYYSPCCPSKPRAEQRAIVRSCQPGWVCKDYYHAAFRTANCRFTAERYCRYGCVNGACVTVSTYDPRRDP